MFIHISVNATREKRHSWGDTQYAKGLARAFRQISGVDASLFFRGEQPERRGPDDVVLRIVGPLLEEPVRDFPNMLWIISPPSLAPSAMLGRYQAVFCASRVFVDLLCEHGLDVQFLHQATESGHFHPDRRPTDAAEIPIAFVGGYAPRADRILVRRAIARGFDVAIWGPGWAGVVPPRHLRGDHLDYDELAMTYASARVVLNSHMGSMRRDGYMSNRTFDAIASGAYVVSDVIPGFDAQAIPDLFQVQDENHMVSVLNDLLARPPLDHAGRVDMHDRLYQSHDFCAGAEALVSKARTLLAAGTVAAPAFASVTVGGLMNGKGGDAPRDATPFQMTDPALSASSQRLGTVLAAQEIVALAGILQTQNPPHLLAPVPAEQQGVFHQLMADLRQMQGFALAAPTPENEDTINRVVSRARRLIEVEQEAVKPLMMRASAADRDALIARVIDNQPMWTHAPMGFTRDVHKLHVSLRQRREGVVSNKPVGVFLHLYHDDLGQVFADRLTLIDAPIRVYISTDTDEKAARLRLAMPDADVRVFENRGRDIWPKLYGFADAYDDHDVVLHLHGKKSLHADHLNEWLDHILKCLIGTRDDVNRILSLFQSIPSLGILSPVPFRAVMGGAHWAANRDIARELAFRMGLEETLPDDARLQFPVGSMFWGRVDAIRPLLDLRLTANHFPPEYGQVDGTLAHAIERMLGVVCTATGHRIIAISGSGQRLHAKHQRRFDSNRALRDAIAAGEFDA